MQDWAARLRRHGWRVNLRPLADKPTLGWLLASWLTWRYLLLPIARFVWAVITTPLDEEPSQFQPRAHEWRPPPQYQY